MVVVRPAIEDLLEKGFGPRPIEVVRPDDLVHLTFSFVNLQLQAGDGDGPPAIRRRSGSRKAFLVVDCHPQHIAEEALFETAEGYPIGKPTDDPPHPPPPLGLPPAEDPPADPDADTLGDQPATPPRPPVFASLSGGTRLVFEVGSQVIPYTVEGLLAAMSRLDLSVAPHAVPPVAPRRPAFADILGGDLVDIGAIFPGPAEQAGVGVVSDLIAVGRMRASAAALEYRFGTDAALAALDNTTLGARLGVERVVVELGRILPIDTRPPLPAPPGDAHTSIELPWRLLISPNQHGAFAHSSMAVEHEGRYELWHSRLGVRARAADGTPILDEEGNPAVDERTADVRTIRAIWARDFDVGLVDEDGTTIGFTPRPVGTDFPSADGQQDRPDVRMSLNSRDRMMLVHETSNFHLDRNGVPGWIPQAVPTNRLMVTTLGGWLDGRVEFATLPDGGLTIEEWKHRAALGRDHEVKVVYSGFLLPFGHKASLVKITERKIKQGLGGPAAYLFQRMFIIVREPERQFRKDTRAIDDGRRLDLSMPLGTVRILTRVTPSLDPPENLEPPPPLDPSKLSSGLLFEPHVLDAPFLFKMIAVDLLNNVVEFSAPLVFMERDHNDPDDERLDTALGTYNTSAAVHREMDLRGQRIAYADTAAADDTVLATSSLIFDAVTADFLGPPAVPQDRARFAPVLRESKAVVPAMSALAGSATPTRLAYPSHYAAHGFAGNAAQVFLRAIDTPAMSFAGQGDRSGGFVTPSLKVQGLSRLTGPIGGDLDDAIANAGSFDVGGFFEGVSAKLFGLIPLKDLFGTLGFTPDRVPTFVTQTLDVASTLKQNAERIRTAANEHAATLGAAATDLRDDVDTLLGHLTALAADPSSPPALGVDLQAIANDLDPFVAAVNGVPAAALPQTQKLQLTGLATRIKDQLANAAAITAAGDALIAFARGFQLPEVINARLDWSTELDPWPSPGSGAIFSPLAPSGRIALAVEIQAPTTPGKDPSVMVSCSITPFDLRLIAPATFLVLHFETIEFSILPGKKPDVNVKLRESDGIEFAGPLEFVNRLKDVIPFDGFSDPPYLDVTAEGVKAGFDLPIPDLAVGVFALTNISLGAHFRVPFIDESIETAFNFATKENPFRLQVSLFAGGGFFGITLTPERVRVLEAALEFGAAIAVNLGVASGGVSVMAGIYFRMETDDAGEESAQLTGYFRMRGEVDVLGLISACIELYLDLTYETSTEKAVGRATISVEVEVAFVSFSVSISCEKKFAGSSGDPSFVDVMGLPPGAPSGAVRPWDAYCRAFADD